VRALLDSVPLQCSGNLRYAWNRNAAVGGFHLGVVSCPTNRGVAGIMISFRESPVPAK